MNKSTDNIRILNIFKFFLNMTRITLYISQ